MTTLTPATPENATRPSVMKRLRALAPHRSCEFGEAITLAELQATKLAALLDVGADGIQAYHLAELPRLRIVYVPDLPVSGMSHWNGQEWVISLASGEPIPRQRFTLLHEYKHIIDHGAASRLYTGDRRRDGHEQAELAADYFAGCALVSKRALKAAWGNGLQRPEALADHFGVSEAAIRVRLAQTGLDTIADREPAARCARPVRTPHQFRQQFRVATRRGERSYA